MTTYDHAVSPGSNYDDSLAIESGLTGHQKRGRARDKNREMKTLTLPTLLRFIQSAGVEKITVFDPHNPSVKHELPVKNQADILYYSGHGYSVDGSLECYDSGGRFTVNEVAPGMNWKEDLEYFIIAGCSVLAPNSTNGFAWGNATLKSGILKGLCGYYGIAPSDTGGSVPIAQQFAAFLTSEQPPTYSGDRVLDAWLEANFQNDALAIVYNRNFYWYVRQLFGIIEKIEGLIEW